MRTHRICSSLKSESSIGLVWNSSGQSTIEFALTLIMMLGFILFYFQLTMIFAFGNFVHYATFMSARAYLSAGPSEDDQKSRAQDVIVSMVKRGVGQSGADRLPWIAHGIGEGDIRGVEIGPSSNFNATDSSLSWMQGVRYTFRSKLFVVPLTGSEKGASSASLTSGNTPPNTVTLTSESWLGREPNDDECRARLGAGSGSSGSKTGWAFDNGC